MPAPRFLTDATLTYAANAKETKKLDRGYVIREIAIRLTCQITSTTAITAADLGPAGLWGIVKNLRLKLNSNTNIRDLSGDQLKLLNYFYYNNGDFTDEQTLVMPAATTRTIESTLIIPLWMVDSIRPIDTQLDATLLSNLEIQVDWGNIEDITDVGDAVLASDPFIETATLNAFGINGPFNTQIIDTEIFQVTGINPKYQIDLAVGNLYRSFLIGGQDSAGYDIVNAIDNIRVFSGGTDYFNIPAELWRRWSDKRERIVQGMNDGSGKFVSANRNMDAWYYVDMVTDGLLSETINAIGLSTLKIELDINQAVDQLFITKQQIVPLAQPAAAA